MAGKCKKCSVDINGAETVAKCVECSQLFHPQCTRLGSSQNFTKTKLKNWKCDSCHGDSASVSSGKSNEEMSSGNTQTILNALSSMKSEINAHTDEKIRDLKVTISVLSENFDKLEAKIQIIENSQGELRRRCEGLERDRDQLRSEAQDLKYKLADAEQHSRSANLEITGLPLTRQEDVYNILKKISVVINVPYKREDISVAHRIRLYSKKHAHPPLVVQFVSRSVREGWLIAARRKKGFNATDLAASLPSSQVYINEQLTPHNKELLGFARKLAKEKKIYYAGYFNGKVMIRPTADPDVPSIRVVSVNDLDSYKNN